MTSHLRRFLYIGFLVPDAAIEEIFLGEKHPQLSAVRFQRSLLKALESGGASIMAITTPPIAAFPRNRRWWVSGGTYHLAGLNVRGQQISGPNLPAVRLLARLMQIVRHGWTAVDSSADGILVYSVHTPMVAASLVLKWRHRLPVFVFIPDRPTFMGGPSNPLKRLLKQMDDALVRRMLSYTDGAFPLTDATGRDWLVQGPRYWPVEGVSDEAAHVLSQARRRDAYIFKGASRPRLLYTGMLAYVMTFATAFHRSPINASVTFMGGGEDCTGLAQLAAVDSRIEVKPFASGPTLASEIERADFLLNPRDPAWPGSEYSFPSKLFEYLCTGKPIISTRLGGVPPEYFGVFRPIDLKDQNAFDTSLERALRIDVNPEAVWASAERLGERLTSVSVGQQLLARIQEWSGGTR